MTAVREHRSVMLLCGAFRRQRRQAGVAKTCYSFTYCTYVIAGTGPELEDALGSSRHVTRILDTNGKRKHVLAHVRFGHRSTPCE